jgi:hypothetical protein
LAESSGELQDPEILPRISDIQANGGTTDQEKPKTPAASVVPPSESRS